jgi:hypothetical protein
MSYLVELVPKYPNYYINSQGEVKHQINGKFVSIISHISKRGYQTINTYINKKHKLVPIHRLLATVFLEPTSIINPEVDHKDGNTLNNSIKNLRWCSRSQNIMNTKLSKVNKSGIKGVSHYKATNKWRAHIQLNKRSIHLGFFESKECAIHARKIASNNLFKEFQRT